METENIILLFYLNEIKDQVRNNNLCADHEKLHYREENIALLLSDQTAVVGRVGSAYLVNNNYCS